MSRVYNFSAGPAAIPDAVVARIRSDIPDWNRTGMSIMEVSHRSKKFVGVAERAKQDLRDLLLVPDDYSILFAQGGATMQFSMVPLNLASKGDPVDYVLTGSWSRKAILEASKYCNVNVVADSTDSGFTYVPEEASWKRSENAAYLHYCANETIAGVEFPFIPDSADAPLVSDMSSTILSRPLDISSFGLIYACAQKNIGPAGLTVVLIRKDLINGTRSNVPHLLDYSIYDRSDSMSNTPPVFSLYVAGLVFEYLKEQGGLEIIGEKNEKKAKKLYSAIDNSSFYSNPVERDFRSLTNIPFVLDDISLDSKFLEGAACAGLANLKGHRTAGGMRASIYNAMPEDGIDTLVSFMREFERING